jgi:hypothetical protein
VGLPRESRTSCAEMVSMIVSSPCGSTLDLLALSR